MPSVANSFSDYESSVKTVSKILLELAKVSNFQQLHELSIKNKLLESCNANMVAFLLESDSFFA